MLITTLMKEINAATHAAVVPVKLSIQCITVFSHKRRMPQLDPAAMTQKVGKYPMSTDIIQPFDFKGHRVRTLTFETGQTWWVLKDVCDALELSNPSRVV